MSTTQATSPAAANRAAATEPAQLPTLPGFIDGWVGTGASGWAVQCRECGRIGRGRSAALAIIVAELAERIERGEP